MIILFPLTKIRRYVPYYLPVNCTHPHRMARGLSKRAVWTGQSAVPRKTSRNPDPSPVYLNKRANEDDA